MEYVKTIRSIFQIKSHRCNSTLNMTCDIQHQRDMLHDWSMRGTLFFCFEIGADFPFGEEHISMPQRLWRRTARPFQSRECVDHPCIAVAEWENHHLVRALFLPLASCSDSPPRFIPLALTSSSWKEDAELKRSPRTIHSIWAPSMFSLLSGIK